MKCVVKWCVWAIAVSCAAVGTAGAYPITDTFTDIVGQGLDPGNIVLVDEHGGPSLQWAAIDEPIDLVWTWDFASTGSNILRVVITNTSSHTMFQTVLAFEQNAYDWKANVLAVNTWDGIDNTSDAAYYFGDIAPSGSSTRDIALMANHTSPSLQYDSMGLDSVATEYPGTSNLSVTHAPEPGTLLLLGSGLVGVVAAARRKLGRRA